MIQSPQSGRIGLTRKIIPPRPHQKNTHFFCCLIKFTLKQPDGRGSCRQVYTQCVWAFECSQTHRGATDDGRRRLLHGRPSKASLWSWGSSRNRKRPDWQGPVSGGLSLRGRGGSSPSLLPLLRLITEKKKKEMAAVVRRFQIRAQSKHLAHTSRSHVDFRQKRLYACLCSLIDLLQPHRHWINMIKKKKEEDWGRVD